MQAKQAVETFLAILSVRATWVSQEMGKAAKISMSAPQDSVLQIRHARTCKDRSLARATRATSKLHPAYAQMLMNVLWVSTIVTRGPRAQIPQGLSRVIAVLGESPIPVSQYARWTFHSGV